LGRNGLGFGRLVGLHHALECRQRAEATAPEDVATRDWQLSAWMRFISVPVPPVTDLHLQAWAPSF
jgi:hypothetical protein